MRLAWAGWLVPLLATFASAGTSPVIARVGESAITADELAARMQAMPRAQLAALGQGDDAIRRAVLDQFIVREVLFTLGARGRALERRDAVRERVDAALRTARLERLREGLVVSEDEVSRYYEANRGQFEAPARIGLWRILCATADDAKIVIDRARATVNAWGWKDLAREHSIDGATKYRGGDLGFVAADGSSSEPSVKVDPVLYGAAERVKDGELVPEPVAEGSSWAVVWRRESMPADRRTLDQEADAIRQVVLRTKHEQAARDLVRSLRGAVRIETNPELLRLVEGKPGQTAPRARPGLVPHASTGSPAPSSSGLR
jgi:peptidyl-prolyl cis-trans isomerase C